jgi:hypothetical protein
LVKRLAELGYVVEIKADRRLELAFAALPARGVCGTVRERFFLEEAASPESAKDSVRYPKLLLMYTNSRSLVPALSENNAT